MALPQDSEERWRLVAQMRQQRRDDAFSDAVAEERLRTYQSTQIKANANAQGTANKAIAGRQYGLVSVPPRPQLLAQLVAHQGDFVRYDGENIERQRACVNSIYNHPDTRPDQRDPHPTPPPIDPAWPSIHNAYGHGTVFQHISNNEYAGTNNAFHQALSKQWYGENVLRFKELEHCLAFFRYWSELVQSLKSGGTLSQLDRARLQDAEYRISLMRRHIEDDTDLADDATLAPYMLPKPPAAKRASWKGLVGGLTGRTSGVKT